MNKATVYWLHLPGHNDIFSQGYIGVSKNPKQRYKRHQTLTENPHLQNVFEKYQNIVQDILIFGETKYCYEIEAKLRPNKEIGWNIIEGGGHPPNSKGRPSGFKGQKHTQEWKNNKKEMMLGNNNHFYGKKHVGDLKRFVSHSQTLPPNAIPVIYKGKEYKSLASASKDTGVSVYYIQKENLIKKGEYNEPATSS